MDTNIEELNKKKEDLLELLRYIDEQDLWNMAKYLINYIEKSDNMEMIFLEFISDIITDAISETEDKLSKEKLEKISDVVEEMKNEENLSDNKDSSETDSLLDEINNI